MKKVSIIIINYNNKEYLERSINSVLAQTYGNVETIFIDNNSIDGSVEFVRNKYLNKNIEIIANDNNLGYSGAANQGIRISNGEYIVIMNPDVIMERDFIENVYNYISKDKMVGAVSGKIFKYDFNNDKKLQFIDTCGIDMYKDRTFVDRGQNTIEDGEFNNIEQVFGVCGAVAFYSRKALNDISINGECFDEDFFAYKEDVDVSWRLNLAGYKVMFLPDAIAYHGRALGKPLGRGLNYIRNRKKNSIFLRGLSVRNQILMVYKNDNSISKKGYRYISLSRRIKLIIYLILFERECLKFVLEAIKLKKVIKVKRDEFQNNKKLNYDFLKLIK